MFSDLNSSRFNTLYSVKSSLISLYLALTFPLIFITIDSLKIISILFLIIGLIFTFNIVNDYVIINENGILFKTSFISRLFGKYSWEILWKDIITIKSFNTSQNSKVHYFITSSKKSFLIPQRLERYEEFKEILSKNLNQLEVDLNYISPLWTYNFLTFISISMFIGEFYAFVMN